MRLLIVCICVFGFGCRAQTKVDPDASAQPGSAAPADQVIWVTHVARQTILGTQTLLNYGHAPPERPRASEFGPELIRRLVEELGIDVVRLEVRPGMEKGPGAKAGHCWSILQRDHTATDAFFDCSYEAANDNEDPTVFNPAAFHFEEVDAQIQGALIPLTRRLRAIGRADPYVILTPNSRGTGAGGFQLADHPEEYAEFVSAVFQHVKRRYGITIDGLEVMNEPDNQWRAGSRTAGSEAEEPGNLARALIAAERRLAKDGFRPEFFGPSVEDMLESEGGTCAEDSLQNCYVDKFLSAEASLSTTLDYLSYHRYQHREEGPGLIAKVAQARGLKTAQTEFMDENWDDIYSDLTVANASLIAQFGLGDDFGHPDDGGRYFVVDPKNLSSIKRGRSTADVAHFSREVRRGAQRYVAMSNHAKAVEAMAFRNVDGRWVVVFRSLGSARVQIGGIADGAYGWFFSHRDASLQLVEQPTVHKKKSTVTLDVPGPGLVTLYGLPTAMVVDAGLGDAWPATVDSGFHSGAAP